MILFFAAAIVVVGDRAVSGVIRLSVLAKSVNPSAYHRLFSYRRWSSRKRACVIGRFVVDRFCPWGIAKWLAMKSSTGIVARTFTAKLGIALLDEYDNLVSANRGISNSEDLSQPSCGGQVVRQ
ncbi:hypothetical protein [Rubripirellula reticaptiva]|uniref:hypothetical protein n=1 Tax=Rubripirellula reticaptiva TaxID=2528013 RepID=UPI0011B45384|nr:hypothetical protein [Rubripirellula reticaptiva]